MARLGKHTCGVSLICASRITSGDALSRTQLYNEMEHMQGAEMGAEVED